MRASSVRMSDPMGTTCGEEGARGCCIVTMGIGSERETVEGCEGELETRLDPLSDFT
jgi:hypothetical protein